MIGGMGMSEVLVERENQEMKDCRCEFFIQHLTPAGTVPLHTHPAVEFLHFLDGSFTVEVEGVAFSAAPGDLVLIRSGALHAVRVAEGEGGHYGVLKLHPLLLFSWFPRQARRFVLPFLRHRPAAVHFPAVALPEEAVRAFRALGEEKAGDPLFSTAVQSAGEDLCLALLRGPLAPAVGGEEMKCSEEAFFRVYESIRVIDREYGSPLTPTEVAGRVHLSYSHFARLFHEVTGKTFKEYLSSVRLGRAEEALFSTDLSVTQIAAGCGYENLSYFILEYRRHFGISPGAARRQRTGILTPT